MDIEELRKLIKKYAIKNAIDYGKADAGSVLGKVIPSAKGVPIPELKKEVNAIVSKVNKMSKSELEKEHLPFEKEFQARAKETAEKSAKPKLVIEGAKEGRVFTRYPPEPGGFMTLGNAKQCILSDELARAYDGKIFLYFDDTNPEKCKQEYVDGIKRDTAWLGVKFGKEYYASDYIEKEYEMCRKLFNDGNAYVCLCTAEQIKKNRFAKRECKHRSQKPLENLSLFDQMLKGEFAEGQAIVRLRGNMRAENSTLRDPALFRIKKAEHYRQGTKYIVWPTYHINTPLIDNFNGVTDVLRGKEYEIFDESYKLVLSYLGLRAPRMHYQAMLQIKGGMTAHKRDIRKFIKDGSLSSWDDPRLLTVMAMKRRGIQPEAIRAFIMRFGLSRTESVVPLDMLLAENKRVIDPIARHLFFVRNPTRLKVEGDINEKARLRLHPMNDFGHREYSIGNTFFIDGSDAKSLESDSVVRLKDLMLLKVKSSSKKEITATRLKPELSDVPTIQWVSDGNYVECSVSIPGNLLDEKGGLDPDSLKVVKGFVESYAKNLKEHEIVQFERFGYCILDDKKSMSFIFISK